MISHSVIFIQFRSIERRQNNKMRLFFCASFLILFATIASCRYVAPYPYYPPHKRQVFGETSLYEIGKQEERRWGFPFITRTVNFPFPSVCISLN